MSLRKKKKPPKLDLHFWDGLWWVTVRWVSPYLRVTLVSEKPTVRVYHRIRWCPWFSKLSHSSKEYEMAKFVKQVIASAEGKKLAAEPKDQDFKQAYPALFEYLTLRSWGPGKARETATLTVFCDGDTWKVSVNDRANHRTVFVSGDTFKATLEAVEAGLQADDLSWREYDIGKSKFRK